MRQCRPRDCLCTTVTFMYSYSNRTRYWLYWLVMWLLARIAAYCVDNCVEVKCCHCLTSVFTSLKWRQATDSHHCCLSTTVSRCRRHSSGIVTKRGISHSVVSLAQSAIDWHLLFNVSQQSQLLLNPLLPAQDYLRDHHVHRNYCQIISFYRQHCAHRKAPVLNSLRGWFWGFSPCRGDTLHRWWWNLGNPGNVDLKLFLCNFSG